MATTARGTSQTLTKRYYGAVRLLLLSDTHANYIALQAVLADAEDRRYQQVIHLGDAVGYGPHPHEVLDKLREIDAVCITGNHDQMLLEYHAKTREYKESIVSSVLKWQLTRLTERDIKWMQTWRDGIDDPEVGARYRHGTPVSLDEYADSVGAAREAFAKWHGRLAFVGHTHIPRVFATLSTPSGEWVREQMLHDKDIYRIPPAARVIINPGSVGQPRDGNPQASYAVYDSAKNQVEAYRVDYEIERTQNAINEAGLPPVLAGRLKLGK